MLVEWTYPCILSSDVFGSVLTLAFLRMRATSTACHLPPVRRRRLWHRVFPGKTLPQLAPKHTSDTGSLKEDMRSLQLKWVLLLIFDSFELMIRSKMETPAKQRVL